MERSDIEDVEALVSINSEASAFQFRQQGKTESFKSGVEAGDLKAGGGKKRKRRGRETLDLDEIEKLKEGLDDQVGEIRKLYDPEDVLDIDDADDGDLNAQIQRLKKLLEQNKAILQGEEVDEEEAEGLADQAEDEDDQDKEKKLQEQREAEEAEFEEK